MILRPGTGAFHAAAFFPIVSAFCWAATLIMTRMMSVREHATTTMIYSSIAGVAILSAMVAFVWVTPSPNAILLGILIVAATVCLVLGLQAISRQLRSADEDRAVLRALGAGRGEPERRTTARLGCGFLPARATGLLRDDASIVGRPDGMQQGNTGP